MEKHQRTCYFNCLCEGGYYPLDTLDSLDSAIDTQMKEWGIKPIAVNWNWWTFAQTHTHEKQLTLFASMTSLHPMQSNSLGNRLGDWTECLGWKGNSMGHWQITKVMLQTARINQLKQVKKDQKNVDKSTEYSHKGT